ncbi:MAG: hypothetical protein GTN82_15640 [Candidatus Aminicenantes bacterium]|nr:hypothetical protein [Candidatus Aminicenantes bacterium]
MVKFKIEISDKGTAKIKECRGCVDRRIKSIPLELFKAISPVAAAIGISSIPGLQRSIREASYWNENLSMVLSSLKGYTENLTEPEKEEIEKFVNETKGKEIIDDDFTVLKPGSLQYQYYRAARLVALLSMGIHPGLAMLVVKNNEETPNKFAIAIHPYKRIQNLKLNLAMRTLERHEARNHPFRNLWRWFKGKILFFGQKNDSEMIKL